MTEFAKLVRYAVPVIVLGAYFILFVCLVSFPSTRDLEELFGYIQKSHTAAILSIGGTFLFALGFLISAMHHLLFWYCPVYPKTSYSDWIRNMEASRRLKIEAPPTEPHLERKLWHVINAIWHTLRSADPGMEKLNSRNDSLTDLMHANGSCLVSVVLAFGLASLCVGFTMDSACLFGVVFLILFLIHWAAFQLSVQNMNCFVQTALFHVLSYRQHASGDGPYIFYYHG